MSLLLSYGIINRMNKSRSYSWRNVRTDLEKVLRELLLNKGWIEENRRSSTECWRLKSDGFMCIFYKSGTLFISYPDGRDSEFKKIRGIINSYVGTRYIPPSKDFLVGFDEVGKGEIIGSIILAGVRFPRNIFDELDIIVDNVDTKRSHSIDYWEEIYRELEESKDSGLLFFTDKILPEEIDEKKSLNVILDQRYRMLIERLISGIDVTRCRLVIDDYGAGKVLTDYLERLKESGAEIVITGKSEDRYLETRIASIIAKRERIMELQEIGIYSGSGNTGDRKTLDWLEDWYRTHREWPWFVKRSFRTVRRIEEYINSEGR